MSRALQCRDDRRTVGIEGHPSGSSTESLPRFIVAGGLR
jgi:hypothetical protein